MSKGRRDLIFALAVFASPSLARPARAQATPPRAPAVANTASPVDTAHGDRDAATEAAVAGQPLSFKTLNARSRRFSLDNSDIPS